MSLSSRPKPQRAPPLFRVLVPVWGEAYVDKFCRFALPALLADGNLPALARRGDCEVLVLTTRESAAIIDRKGSLAPLAAICRHAFILIDDLLAFDEYGMVLTVAYGRGIASMGERQTETAFVFLNADFVFSDGLLAAVLDRIERGYRAVLVPSLRCVAEQVTRQLDREVARHEGVLPLYPAELVRLALDNLHPTAAASVVNEGQRHSEVANQFFWRVDDRTLLGRYFLMFMLCIRPETPFRQAVGWCDYAFVPELVPSGNLDIIADSADGFVLELQARDGEAGTLRDGRFTPEDYAPRLSHWTTDEHRRYARHDVVFQAGREPAGLDRAKAEFGTFMAELFGKLSEPATSHRAHPYWVRSIDRQRPFFPKGLPPEFAPPDPPEAAGPKGIFGRWLRRARREGPDA